ncbi:Amino acid permease-associated region [Neorhizobium galegae bv. officinalis]|uniref:Amino acid permease-associated region n=1 Tax=Neorhizobium galegae bv. officinalis TaxID=323656 RepID=A0A0T7G0D0_NEOGA|nr:APC family permease [Neorhizobium galegae]CDZ40706.1 Amino acid permease-associated region [Neorhizobium galegae bv. officinalis]CDZ53616.1 Amino acid permease-associated region [Neorhizobium galegae bv. officinalis]
MSHEASAPTLRKDALGVLSIVLLVIATNGPLTVIIGAVPTAIAFGNGLGLPSVFLLIGLAYLIFSIGFAAMSHHIKNAGAFYAYVSNGLGHPAGVGAAFLAVVAYASLNLALYGMFGLFGSMLFTRVTGLELPWWIICAAFVAIVHVFASRNIQFNGRVLGLLMLAEVGIALVFNVGVLFQGPGPDGWVMESFQPSVVFTPGFGSAVVFVIAAFMGFETAAIYSEEARNSKRNIPLALFFAVAVITLLDGSATWFMISAYGTELALAQAASNPGMIWFDIATKVLGGWAATAMELLMITSLFAAILSFQNTLSRYFFSLGREGVIWTGFAKLHPTQQSPYVASAFQSGLMLVGVLVAGLLGVDPITQLMPVAAAPASIAIVAVQVLTAIAVIGFFRSNPRDTNLWQRLIAPAISIAVLGWILWMMVTNVAWLTGGQTPVLDIFIPVFVAVIGVGGVVYAMWLRQARPESYAKLARLLEEV